MCTLQHHIIVERVADIKQQVRQAEEALEAVIALVPVPYGFHTSDNHFEKDLKISLGYLAYQAVRGCVINTLNALKDRLVSGPSGLFYITRPMFDVDVELHYPNVEMMPSLEMIQEAINDVAMQCLNATKLVSMWGATPVQCSYVAHTCIYAHPLVLHTAA